MMKKKKDIHGGNIWDAAVRTGRAVEDIIDFSSSINPLGPPKGVLKAVRSVAGVTLTGYPDPASKELKRALSDYLGVAERYLIPGSGSTELIHLIPRIIDARPVLIAEPAFSEYRAALENSGVSAHGLRLEESTGFAIDPTELEREFERRPYAAFFMANPANPTGAVTEKSVLLKLAEICAKYNATLVVDEAFVDFNEGLSICRQAPKLGNVLILRSATKFFSLAGLRIGYAISSRHTIEKFSKAIPPWSVNNLATLASIKALNDKGFVSSTNQWLIKEKAYLSKGLEGIGAMKVYPTGANYIMLKLNPGGITATALAARLLQKGILIRDLSCFAGLGRMYFRVAVKGRAENTMLIHAIKECLS